MVFAAALMAAGAVTIPAAPASATTCATSGHAYFILNGTGYFSGYEGQNLNIQTVTIFSNIQPTEVGANGIMPGTVVTFTVDNTFLKQVLAGSNCVANQVPVTMPTAAGTYTVRATYVSGNTNTQYTDTVVIVTVPSTGGGGGGGDDPTNPDEGSPCEGPGGGRLHPKLCV